MFAITLFSFKCDPLIKSPIKSIIIHGPNVNNFFLLRNSLATIVFLHPNLILNQLLIKIIAIKIIFLNKYKITITALEKYFETQTWTSRSALINFHECCDFLPIDGRELFKSRVKWPRYLQFEDGLKIVRFSSDR